MRRGSQRDAVGHARHVVVDDDAQSDGEVVGGSTAAGCGEHRTVCGVHGFMCA